MKNIPPTATPIGMLPMDKTYYIQPKAISMQYAADVTPFDLLQNRCPSGIVLDLLGNAFPFLNITQDATIPIIRVKNINTGDAFVLDFKNCGFVFPITLYSPSFFQVGTPWIPIEAHYVTQLETNIYKVVSELWEQVDNNILVDGYKCDHPEMETLDKLIVEKSLEEYGAYSLHKLLDLYVHQVELCSVVPDPEINEPEHDDKKQAFVFEQTVNKKILAGVETLIKDAIMFQGKFLPDTEKTALLTKLTKVKELKNFEEVFYEAQKQ